ncbi:MAG: DNA polymerase I [Clostridiales bacterium]|nr:DNA polymerase I [Clostridiales bacterium]MCF8022368.1 DNA polymerase I [Clostridiales bacterium]
MSVETFLIIDGNSLAHRAFHAIPLLSNSEGLITNAAYGFTTMLTKALKEHAPEHAAVAFDKGKITFRHSQYKEYKMQRKATPEELRPQFPLLKDILEAYQISIFEVENYEADDLIGTLTAAAESKDIHCLVLTGDRDLLQLVSPLVSVLHTVKGISEIEYYNAEKVKDKFGVPPERLADYKGLVGDTSDNIPGVPGIGPKTAYKLLQEYPSLEELLKNKENISSRWRNKLNEYEEQAVMSKKLAVICREAPVDIDIEKCRWKGPNYPQLLKIFSRLEFKTLIKDIIEKEKNVDDKETTESQEIAAYKPDYQAVQDSDDLLKIKSEAQKTGKISLVIEQQPGKKPTAAALTISDKNFYIPFENNEIPPELRDIFADPHVEKYCHDGKQIIRLLHHAKVQFRALSFDTMVAAHLLNSNNSGIELSDLALQYLDMLLPEQEKENISAGAECIYKLTGTLQNHLEENGLDKLYRDIEIPLISILAEMESAGVAIDADKLREMSLELEKQIHDTAVEIYSLCGEEFNINSPRQLGQILFEKLELPVIKRTKTGYSTNAEVLEELASAHPVPQKIIEHRQLVKLKTTYVDSMSNLISPETSKIHTTFHQAVTATGRLSSAEPNLQNIPIRLEQGRKIRKVFVPQKTGNVIFSADYSQIELRILAHMSGDELLQEAFHEGQDIHTRTASEVFGIKMSDVTKEMRSRAKAVNFGIVYGMSEFGLSKDINVTRAEARRYIDNYFSRYSGVKNFINRTIEKARDNGCVTTMLNRRRYLPDLFSPNRNVRNFGERAAINTPIQGSAADIIKIAMVNTYNKLNEYNFQAKMILQVHDELIFDVPQEELSALKEIVKDSMENAYELCVPLIVDLKAGTDWYNVETI